MTFHKGPINSTREYLVEDLINGLDIRSLEGYEQVPVVNSWLEHAPANFAEFDFQKTVRACQCCMITPSRLSWGGRAINSMHMWAK